ncbi:MAG: tetratricopeptide repeat protein [Acetobacter malorum]
MRSGALIAPCLLASLSAAGLASAQTAQPSAGQAQSTTSGHTTHTAPAPTHSGTMPHTAAPSASGKTPSAPGSSATHPAAPAASPAPGATSSAPSTGKAPVAAPHKKLTRPQQIAALADQLAQAKTPEDAQMLEARLEALRAAGLSPTTQLLLRRAQKDSQADKPDDAVEDLSDALALQPDSAILWRSRAQMRLAAGDFKAAITDLGEALQRDGRDAKSWGLLSTVEDQRKDSPAALKAWQKVLELNPMSDKNHKHLDALHIKAFGQPT